MDGEVLFEFVLFWGRIGWQIASLIVIAAMNGVIIWLMIRFTS